MATFPSINPSFGQRKISQPNIKTIRYADGFEQRQLIGIAAHQNPKNYNLEFKNITEAESDTIEYFLNERALDQASFTFTPPGEDYSKTGTYSQSGTTITITITDHQLFANDSITVDFTSGSATDGNFSVVSLTNANTFVITASASATTSGNCTVTKTGASQFVCKKWNKTINFANRATISATFEEVFEP
tara:strand:+ start:474 stop:1043 length:570 start_codon:yes stop_codon:yes gene_type:complete